MGAIVHIHAPGTFEVEFVRGSGRAFALLTLTAGDIRAAEDRELAPRVFTEQGVAMRSVREGRERSDFLRQILSDLE